MRRSSARAQGLKAGAEGFEPSGVLPPLVFKTSAFVRSAMPPHTLLWRRLYDLRAEHLSSGAQASPGWCTMFVCSYRLEATRRKSRLREPVSGLTHLVGGLLALVALIVLLTKAAGWTN